MLLHILGFFSSSLDAALEHLIRGHLCSRAGVLAWLVPHALDGQLYIMYSQMGCKKVFPEKGGSTNWGFP